MSSESRVIYDRLYLGGVGGGGGVLPCVGYIGVWRSEGYELGHPQWGLCMAKG